MQLADLVAGIVVSTLAGGLYGQRLFEDVAQLFLLNPHEGATSYASIFSASALGFGLILFPREFRRKGGDILEGMDRRFLWVNGQLSQRT